VVIDLMGARFGSPEGILEAVGRGGIHNIRASQYSADVVRVVLEVDGPLEYTVRTGETWVRIALANPSGVDFEPWSSAPSTSVGSAARMAGASIAVPTSARTSTTLPGTQVIATASTSALGLAPVQNAQPIWISFQNTPIREMAFAFSDHADRSIIVGSDVNLNISAEIRGQPWDIALAGILNAYGLVAREQATGIIEIQDLEFLTSREEFEPLVTRVFRVSFSNAVELLPTIESVLTRGNAVANASTNNITVTDLPRVIQAVDELLRGIDVQTPEITIAARIMFVNRTNLAEFGVTYDLKDSFGNQLNQLAPGGRDLNGDGRIDFSPNADPIETVDQGTDVISLGGTSLAALGNANQRVTQPAIQFLTSLVLGRRTLISFVEALQSVNLTDVQASPLIRVLDNVGARTQVGERTPIRVADYGSQSGGGGGGGAGGATGIPRITTELVETGIILDVTPHLASGDLIWMDVYVERSGVELGEIDLGPQFNTQNARSRVLAADGETVVIGGLTVTERTEVRSGIPILQDLPLVGRLFRLTREQTIQRDLMILLTPQINRR